MSRGRDAVPVDMRRRRTCAAVALGMAPWHRAMAAADPRDREAASGPLHRFPTGDIGALLAVDARLDGRPWRCLLDSGASIALVSPALARREKLEVVERSRVATLGGTMQLERVILPRVEFAGQTFETMPALVLDLERHLGDAGAAVEGLLGAPVLRQAVLRLDLAAARMQWGEGAGTADGTAWPLRWDQELPVIDLALGDRAPAPFLFDTGNAGSLVIFARHAQALLAGAGEMPAVTVHELGGSVTVHPVLLERLSAPGYVARDVPTVFEGGANARRGGHFDRLAGSAGMALFGAGRVTLDGPRERLTVSLPGLPEGPSLPGGFGFSLRSVAGAAPEVTAVFDGGPAARVGVRPGQQLRAIDGHSLTGMRAADAWRAVSGIERALFTFEGGAAPVALSREAFFPRWR